MSLLSLSRFGKICSLFLGLASLRVAAETLPSFNLDYSSWHATDIVEVSEGPEIDGEVTIKKVFKGGASVGSVFKLESLRQFADKQRRGVGYSLFDEQPSDASRAATYLDNQRMILFLKRAENGQSDLDTAEAASLTWKKDIRLSMLWLEPSKVYCFIQYENPGPCKIDDLHMTSEAVVARIERAAHDQAALDRITNILSSAQRAKETVLFARSASQHARTKALQILADCKADGILFLQSLLEKPIVTSHDFPLTIKEHVVINWPDSDSEVMTALVEAALGENETLLVFYMSEESLFWQGVGPKLEKGWWNRIHEDAVKVKMLRNRYGRTLSLVRGLQKKPVHEARPILESFRRFWRSLPQLEDKSGLTQMSEACDLAIENIDKAK